MGAPDPALIARFRADCDAALEGVEGRLALAVSGGPDSMAMLALAHAAFPGAIVVATVDHRLRPESAGEAAMVADRCARLGVEHAVLVPEAAIRGASLQAQARAARYALLLPWAQARGAAALATAHHADDQAETFLMRAARGSGVAGLAAIRPRRDGAAVPVIRPLLRWRRAELRAVAEAAGMPFVDDPANRDDTHDRTRFRQLLEATPWLDIAAVARAAEHVGEAEEALRTTAALLWGDRATHDADAVALDVADLPRELRRRLVRRAVGEVRRTAGVAVPEWSDAANIEPLLDALETGSGATQAGVRASATGHCWLFRAAPPRRSH